jgi:transposase
MEGPKRFVGLDVHKDKTVACILDQEGKVVYRGSVATARPDLRAFCLAILKPSDQVVLEATCNSYAVAVTLRPYVDTVTVANPRQVRAIAAARIKTDAIDAYTLAKLLLTGFIPAVWIPNELTMRLRQMTSRRSSLVSDKTTVKNRLHSSLAQDLIKAPETDLFGKGGLEWLRTEEFPEYVRSCVDSELRMLEVIERELGLVEKAMAELGNVDPQLKLLMTLPGVNLISGIGLLAAIGDVSRFPEADKMASYVGLIPSTRQSANKCYHGPITKQGNTNARWLMIQAAQHTATHPGPLGVFYRKKRAQKCHNVAVVATARKMVCIAWHMLTNNEPYRYALPEPTKGKLAKLRVLATGERRSTGPKAGTPSPVRGGPPMRTIPSLEEVYTKEGLPEPKPIDELPEGEKKALRSSKVLGKMRELRQAKRVPRRTKTKSAVVEEGPSGSESQMRD